MRQGSPSTRLLCCYHKFYSIFLVKISLVFTSSFLCHEWTSPAGSLKWLLGRSLTSLDQGNEWHRHPLCLRLATGMWKLQITQSSQCSRKRSQWGQHLWCRERGDYELIWKSADPKLRACSNTRRLNQEHKSFSLSYGSLFSYPFIWARVFIALEVFLFGANHGLNRDP